MRRASFLAIVVALTACADAPAKIGAAALTAALAVAAAGVNRAATDDCMAACPQGSRCDHHSGTCVPLPCHDECPANWRCSRVAGKEMCVEGQAERPAEEVIPPAEEPEGAPGAASADRGDPCRGLCFEGERCVSDGGAADCVR